MDLAQHGRKTEGLGERRLAISQCRAELREVRWTTQEPPEIAASPRSGAGDQELHLPRLPEAWAGQSSTSHKHPSLSDAKDFDH
jgi:hypothetical protein